MTFRRWLIEASFIPAIVIGTFFVYYVRFIYGIFDEYQSIYFITIMLKMPLFFLMRYAECQHDFFLNKFEAFIICTIYELRSE